MKSKIGGEMMLFAIALIWGTAIVAQRYGMDFIGPFAFNGGRMVIGFLVLIPLILFLDSRGKKAPHFDEKIYKERKVSQRKDLVIGAIACGGVLFVASTLQQVGLIYTTAGKGGFITALYIVIVPLAGIALRKKVRAITWGCVLLAVIGLFLLSVSESFSINKGDILMLVCAVGFAGHILATDYFVARVDNTILLSCLQFLVAAIFSVPFMCVYEDVTIQAFKAAAFPLLYLGIMSSGVAYTLQMVAQKRVDPTMTSLIVSFESVVAVIAGIILLGETINTREMMGCVFMFVAIIVSQLPSKDESLNKKLG